MYSIAAAFVGAGLTLAIGYSLGRLLLRRPAPLAAHLAVGSAAFSVLIFALLSAHLAKPVVMVAVAIASALAAWRLSPQRRAPEPAPWLALVAAAPFAILYLIHALAPEIRADGLSYHLNLPLEARRSGGFPAQISFFNMIPLGTEALFAAAFGIGGEAAAKLVHLAFLLASLPLTAAIGGVLGLPAWTGWAAGVLYLVTPVVGITGASTYNDAALVFFILAAVYLVLRWRESADPAFAWAAGLCAGFCYAIKFTGGLIAPVAATALAARGNLAAAARLLAAAALVAGPWLARSAWLTGNPFAPLLNRQFPNAFFHAETEQKLGQFLRSYGAVGWDEIPLELAVHGEALEGLLGPVWLLAPLALLALRRPAGRILWLAAALSLVPFLLNHGTRFVMPALPFLALAAMSVLPRRAAFGVMAVHCFLSWPLVVALYCSPGAWRIDHTPWQAALGLEDAEAYRMRRSAEARIARMVEAHTNPADPILDLADTPAAVSRRELTGYWQTALGDSLLQAVRLGITPDRGSLVEWIAKFPPQSTDIVRIISEPLSESWRIHELRLEDAAGNPILAHPGWSLTASHHVEETPWAMDGNLATSWATWDRAPEGAFLEVRLPSPAAVASIRLTASHQAQITAAGHQGRWTVLPGLNLRRQAIAAAGKSGFRYVLARSGSDAVGRIGADMADGPPEWSLKPVASVEGTTLFSIVP